MAVKLGMDVSTDLIKNLLAETPDFFYAYQNEAPLSLTNKVFEMSQNQSLNKQNPEFWMKTPELTEHKSSTTFMSDFILASSPVYQKIFEEIAQDTDLQQKMWEKKKVLLR